jgi:hypothetical protein
MKTNDKRLKPEKHAETGVTSEVSEEKTEYRRVNRESGKQASTPTEDKDMLSTNVARRKLYPDSRLETGKHHPGVGV